jgi:hypothetical protein
MYNHSQNGLLPAGFGKCCHRNGFVKARNGSVYKHFSDFYHLTMVNAKIYR